MNDLWPRIRAVVRRLKAVAASLDDSANRARAIQTALPSGSAVGWLGDDETVAGDTYTITAYGACGSILTLQSADVYFYIPVFNPTLGYGVLQPFFMGQTNSLGILVTTFSFPWTGDALYFDAFGQPMYPALAVEKLTYNGQTAFLVDRSSGVAPYPKLFNFTVTLLPATDYSLEPAVFVASTIGGTGASIQSNTHLNLNVSFGGSGYDTYTGISFGGGYDTGLAATADIGKITGITISNGGTGYSGGSVIHPVPGGTGASITGNVSNGSVTSYTINNGGSGYGAIPTISVGGTIGIGGRHATCRAQISGGAITGIIVDDVGWQHSGATAPCTVLGGRGAGDTLNPIVNGSGVITGLNIVNPGYGYLVPPTGFTIFGGGGSGAAFTLTNDSSIARVEKTRAPDIYGCMGSNNFPMMLTGNLTSQFGTIDLGDKHVQYGLGNVLNDSTMPNTLVNPGYYPVVWSWYRGGYGKYTYTVAGGSLTSVTITVAGYGYLASQAVVIVGSGGGAGRFHFTLNGSGSLTGFAIDVAGSGLTNGTFSGTLPSPQFGEWELECLVFTDVDSGTGITWPLPAVFTDSLGGGVTAVPPLVLPSNTTDTPTTGPGSAIARVRATTYGASYPVTASYDFTGSQVDNIVFQGGSRVVTHVER